MSWGLGMWGLSPWGLAATTLASARALTTQTVLVTLTAPAQAKASYLIGDALNPLTWAVTNTITGQEFTILGVTKANDAGTDYWLHTMEKLGPFVQAHEVEAIGLLAEDGSLAVAPLALPFFGLTEEPNVNPAATAPLVDLENTGGLRITAAGDYAEQTRGQIVRKIIQRRLLTQPGGFFYLTEFGLGINIKQPMTIPALVNLKAQMELQMKAEPEVVEAQATLSLNALGYVVGQLRVRLQSGTDVEFIPISSTVQF